MSTRCVAAAVVVAAVVSVSARGAAAAAEACPGNPQALGTSRVIAVDPTDHARIGSMQYPESLPLRDKEVVLTFDDGPLPRYTGRILDALAAECVKATFFLVGSMVKAYPEWARRIYDAGHTVGTHSYSHPRFFRRLSYEKGISEIDRGRAAVQAALGPERPLAPFFRFPGFGNSREFERYLVEQDLMTWGADVPADDWKHISAEKIKERALRRLAQKGRGILLLHDIQPATALALPGLLDELKARGYHIVHVVPATAGRPKTVAPPEAWVYNRSRMPVSPPLRLAHQTDDQPAFSVPSPLSFGFPYPLAERILVGSFDGERPPMELPQTALARVSNPEAGAAWPPADQAAGPAMTAEATQAVPNLDDINEPAAFGGARFTPEARPEPADHAMLTEEPRPPQLAATPRRRPRTVRTARPARVERQASRVERQASSRDTQRGAFWARSLNWFYAQPQ